MLLAVVCIYVPAWSPWLLSSLSGLSGIFSKAPKCWQNLFFSFRCLIFFDDDLLYFNSMFHWVCTITDVFCSLVHSCMLCDNSISSVVMMDNNQELSNKAFFSYNGVNAQWSWVKILFSSLFVIHSLDAAASKHFFLYYCSIQSFFDGSMMEAFPVKYARRS